MSRSEITSFAGLADLRAKLIALPAVSARIAEKVAPALSALAQQSFDAAQSPYGDPWGVGKDGKPITEKKSGKLRSNALRYVAAGRKVRASVGAVAYAKYQLKHGLLPKSGALPAAWDARVTEIAQRELDEALHG